MNKFISDGIDVNRGKKLKKYWVLGKKVFQCSALSIAFIFVLQIINNSIYPLGAILLKKMVVQVNEMDSKIYVSIILLVFIYILQLIFGGFINILMDKTQLNISCSLYEELFYNIHSKALTELDKSTFLQKIKYSREAIDSEIRELIFSISSLIGEFVGAIITAASIFYVDKFILGLFIVSCVMQNVFTGKSTNENIKLIKEKEPIERKILYIDNLLSNKNSIKECRIYKSESWLLEKRKKYFSEKKKMSLKYSSKWTIINIVWSILMYILEFCVLKYLFEVYRRGALTLDDFIFIVESQAIFVVKFGSLIKQINNFKIKNLYISSYIDICFSKENEQDENNKEIVEDRRKVLELKNISFAYGEKKVIENLSFSIGLGEKIAIFGENGSGKSTLVKLLLGLLTPDKGEICYCNSEIGVIFQDFGKYSFSVKENISLNREFSDKDIFEALFSFGGNNILTGLPNSIYTNIGVEYYNDGVDFSGGQWQKLALARGMIGENMLYILDEPFSALDALAEKVQYDLLFSNYRFESFVIVSHQMGLANMVDKVILLENGKIIAYGVHNELMKNCKKYRQMYETQSKYYEN